MLLRKVTYSTEMSFIKPQYYLLSFLIFIALNCSPDDSGNPQKQQPTTAITTLGGSGNESAKSIVKTLDGGYAILGYTQSMDGDIIGKQNNSFDYWLLKFSGNHEIQWQKTYGGSDEDRGSDIIQTNDGGFAVIGFSKSSDGDVSTNSGLTDFWFTKLDASGTIIWEKSFGFSGVDTGISCIQTKDNGFLLTGILDVTASGGDGNSKSFSAKRHAGGDFWIIKLDASGTKQWSRYYGGTFTDTPNGIVQTQDNGYIIIGFSDSSDVDILNNKGSYDFWVVKISGTGSLIWEKSFGGSEIDEAWSIIDSGDENYLIVGNTRSNDEDVSLNKGAADLWVIKINNDGDLLWEKNLGGSSFDAGRSISKTQDNSFIISGNSRSVDGDLSSNKGQNDAWIVKIDANGNLLWQKSIGGSGIDLTYDAIELNDNSIVAVGESNSSDQDIVGNKGFTDLLIVKIDE